MTYANKSEIMISDLFAFWQNSFLYSLSLVLPQFLPGILPQAPPLKAATLSSSLYDAFPPCNTPLLAHEPPPRTATR